MFKLAGIVLLALSGIGTAAAQSKVGVINSQKAVIDTAEIKKAQAELEAKFKPRQDQALKLQKDLQDIQAQLQSGKLNQTAEQDLQIQGQRKQRELQRIQEDLQADVDRERNEILQRTGQRMQDVVKKLADEKGLDVVIDSSNTVFFKPALEFTAEATAAYDKAYPVK
jgi:outer membrane protein